MHEYINDDEQQQRADEERRHDRDAEIVQQLVADLVLLRDLNPGVARAQHEDVPELTVDPRVLKPATFGLNGSIGRGRRAREQRAVVAPAPGTRSSFRRGGRVRSRLSPALLELLRQRDHERGRDVAFCTAGATSASSTRAEVASRAPKSSSASCFADLVARPRRDAEYHDQCERIAVSSRARIERVDKRPCRGWPVSAATAGRCDSRRLAPS